jgi:hypothetical protein
MKSNPPKSPLTSIKKEVRSSGRSYIPQLWHDGTTPDIHNNNSFNPLLRSLTNCDSLGSHKYASIQQVSSPHRTGSWFTGKPGFTTPKK